MTREEYNEALQEVVLGGRRRMNASKEEITKDLKFCKELMDRLVKYTENNYNNLGYNGSVIKDDIKRLRRELNNVSHKLEWDYGREKK